MNDSTLPTFTFSTDTLARKTPEERLWLFFEASESGNEPLLQSVLACPGVSVDARDPRSFAARTNRTALQCACGASGATPKMTMVNALLAAGATLDLFDHAGATALHHAAFKGCAEVVARLLQAASHLVPSSAPSSPAGVTPLSSGVLSHQAWFASRHSMFGTPLRHAVSAGHPEVARLLLAAGSSANEEGLFSLLHMAVDARENQAALAEVLLAAGADPEALDEKGRTPAARAAGNGQTELASLIRALTLRRALAIALPPDQAAADAVRL